MGQRLKIGFGGTDLGDLGRVLQIHGELVNSLHGLLAHLLQITGVGILNTECIGNVAVFLAAEVLFLFHNRSQQNAVGHAVGNA